MRYVGYTMRSARRRYRQETRTRQGLSFRAWARRTYNASGCVGKLAQMVRR